MYSGAYYQAGNKDGKRKRQSWVRWGICGNVNIETDGPNIIYLIGSSYAHTLTSESINRHITPLLYKNGNKENTDNDDWGPSIQSSLI